MWFTRCRGVDYLNSLQLIPSQAQHRIEFAFPWICPVDLPENTLIVSRDGRKSALVAESVSAGTELRSLTTKGFKVGDRLIQELDADVFNPPLTITAVTPDRESATQVIGIESWDYDATGCRNTPLATPDHRIKLPVSAVGLESPAPALQFLTLEDFSEREVVQIQPTKQGSELPTARNPARCRLRPTSMLAEFLLCAPGSIGSPSAHLPCRSMPLPIPTLDDRTLRPAGRRGEDSHS